MVLCWNESEKVQSAASVQMGKISQRDSKVPVMLELWGMRSTPLLPSLPGPLWPGVVAPDNGHACGLKTLLLNYFFLHLNCVLMLN